MLLKVMTKIKIVIFFNLNIFILFFNKFNKKFIILLRYISSYNRKKENFINLKDFV